jgi:dihydroorotase-like cyclic amidohydrolase
MLWQALAEGVIDAIASDHYTECLTPLPVDPAFIPAAAAGIAGLEVSLRLIMDQVLKGRLSLERFVDVTAQKPAQIAGLSDRKGLLEKGMHADFVIWDPKSTWTVAPLGNFSRIDTTPFVDWRLQGIIRETWVRGQLIWNGEKICVPAGYGDWAKSSKG